MTSDPLVFKVLKEGTPVVRDMTVCFDISSIDFIPIEIEALREEDVGRQQLGYDPFIANFLPDDTRPEGVKKL